VLCVREPAMQAEDGKFGRMTSLAHTAVAERRPASADGVRLLCCCQTACVVYTYPSRSEIIAGETSCV
jgi:hypothetical protein